MTRVSIFKHSRGFPTLLHVGYHTFMNCIQFDMTECATTQSQITFKCVNVQSHIIECATKQLCSAFKHATVQSWIMFI